MDKEYLNEKSYNNVKKGLVFIGILVILSGLIGGGFLIKKGFDNKEAVDKEWTDENIQAKIDNLQFEYTSLESQISTTANKITELERQKTNESVHAFSVEWYTLEDEIKALKKEIEPTENKMKNVKSEISQLENTDIEFEKQFNSDKYIPLFVLGGIATLITLLIGAGILNNAYGRQILAWKAQQVMPIAQEGIEKMGPSIAKVVKDIKEEISEDEKDNK